MVNQVKKSVTKKELAGAEGFSVLVERNPMSVSAPEPGTAKPLTTELLPW